MPSPTLLYVVVQGLADARKTEIVTTVWLFLQCQGYWVYPLKPFDRRMFHGHSASAELSVSVYEESAEDNVVGYHKDCNREQLEWVTGIWDALFLLLSRHPYNRESVVKSPLGGLSCCVQEIFY